MGVGVKDPTALPPEQRLPFFGKNSGNLVFSEAAFRIVKNARRTSYRTMKVTAEDRDCVVIAAANWLNAFSDFGNLADILETLDLPVVMIGVGAQTKPDGEMPTLSDGTLRLMKIVSERSKSISARGEFTCELLSRYGIHNVEPTGCPSLLLTGKHGPRIDRRPTFGWDDVAIHSTRHLYTPARPFQQYLYKQAFAHKADIVLQSEYADLRFAGDPHGETDSDKKAQYILPNTYGASGEELAEYLKWHAKIFFDLDSWVRYLKSKSFVVGTRFHGTIVALLAGTPSVLLTHDSRTSEMVQVMGIPHVPIDSIDTSAPLDPSRLFSEESLAELSATYPGYHARFMDFFARNSIPILEHYAT